MKDKTLMIIWAMVLIVVLVGITASLKIVVDGNVRVTEIKELKR